MGFDIRPFSTSAGLTMEALRHGGQLDSVTFYDEQNLESLVLFFRLNAVHPYGLGTQT
jgi:hypothetical protein